MFTIKEMAKKDIMMIIKEAINLKKNNLNITNKKSIANIFIEPSTRTKISFLKAQKELEMDIYDLNLESSSLSKKESLYDTIETLKSYGINNFVIRSKEPEYWKDLTNIKDINIINAGDGIYNHPTQALLDAMTIFENFNTLDDLKILICGDIKNSRVYHSFRELMSNFNSDLFVSAPSELKDEDLNIKYVDFNKSLPEMDVVIMLRIQHERHNNNFIENNYNAYYGINKYNIKVLKKNSIIMHPGPVNRGLEIDSDIDYEENKIKILEQVKNGVYIRKVILGRL